MDEPVVGLAPNLNSLAHQASVLCKKFQRAWLSGEKRFKQEELDRMEELLQSIQGSINQMKITVHDFRTVQSFIHDKKNNKIRR